MAKKEGPLKLADSKRLKFELNIMINRINYERRCLRVVDGLHLLLKLDNHQNYVY